MSRFDQIDLGDQAAFSKTISETDVYQFAGVSGDFNPMHVDAVYASRSRFGQRIAHGLLSASLISTVIGMYLPGPGTVYLSQSLKFLAPVYLGDTLTARVEVIEKISEKKRLRLKTTCTNQEDRTVIEGEALVTIE